MKLSLLLADLNNIVIWMVSTRPVISKPSSPCTNPLVTVPRVPIPIGIIITFMFHSFFNSLARSRYLSLFSHSFNFTLWSVRTAKSTLLILNRFLYAGPKMKEGSECIHSMYVCFCRLFWEIFFSHIDSILLTR